ncbi:hypothetical protein GCWU000246_00367 [Jonquetella anthropi E3_33 E1]|nr:hypothetical protein GCWU000246_00367 [Jonquetella anthropi E3_33 E1]
MFLQYIQKVFIIYWDEYVGVVQSVRSLFIEFMAIISNIAGMFGAF